MKNLIKCIALCLWYSILQGMNAPQDESSIIRIAFKPCKKAAQLCFLVRNPEYISILQPSAETQKEVAQLQVILAYIETSKAGWGELTEDFPKSSILLQALFLLLDERKTLAQASKKFERTSQEIPAIKHVIDTIIKNDWKHLASSIERWSSAPTTFPDESPMQLTPTISTPLIPFIASLEHFLTQLRTSVEPALPQFSSNLESVVAFSPLIGNNLYTANAENETVRQASTSHSAFEQNSSRLDIDRDWFLKLRQRLALLRLSQIRKSRARVERLMMRFFAQQAAQRYNLQEAIKSIVDDLLLVKSTNVMF